MHELILLLALLDAPASTPPKKAVPRPSPSPVTVIEDAPVDAPGFKQPDTPVVERVKETPVEKANSRGFHYDSQLGALYTGTAADGSEISPFFWINTDGPLPVGDRSIGRLGARVGLTTLPGRTLNALDVNTYNALEADFWGGGVIGKLKDVETTLFLEGGFGSRMKGSVDPEPQRRLVRNFGGGVRFDARRSSAYVLAKIGFDESTTSCASTANCYDFHSGLAIMMRGQVPLYKKSVLFTGDVSLSLGGSVSWLQRTDILRFGLTLDPIETVKALR